LEFLNRGPKLLAEPVEALSLLPPEIADKDALALGCGTGFVSGWFAIFTAIGSEVTDYQELYAPEWASCTRATIPADRAKIYPLEQVWQHWKTGEIGKATTFRARTKPAGTLVCV